jgi:hypothetical protein
VLNRQTCHFSAFIPRGLDHCAHARYHRHVSSAGILAKPQPRIPQQSIRIPSNPQKRPPRPPSDTRVVDGGPSRFLLEFGLPDIGPAQLDIEHPLHGGQHLLIGGRGAALKVGDDGGRRVALCCELALRQGLGLELSARLGDGVADVLADRLGLDDVV